MEDAEAVQGLTHPNRWLFACNHLWKRRGALTANFKTNWVERLVVLTDTADFESANAKNIFDAQAPERAEAAASQLIGQMQATTGLNLVVIDAHEIGNFNKKHHMWPTWQRLSQRLTDEVGDGNTGLNIQATDESQIDEAFDKVAGAMQGGAAG